MTTGYSGFGNGKNASYPLELTMRPENKAITCQTRVILEGTRENGMYVYIDNALIPLLNYIDNSKWFSAATLAVGNNAVQVKSYDNIYHRYSTGVTVNVERKAIDTNKQYKNYYVSVNSVDYTDNIIDFMIDNDNDLTVDKAEITLQGNYMQLTNFDYGNEIIIKIDDGFYGQLTEVFKGKIESKNYDFRNGDKTTKITAYHKIISALENKNSLWVAGMFNGDVQKELFTALGITNPWVFNKYKYSGKRYLNDIKPLDVIKDLAAVNGELIDFVDNNKVNMIPDEYLNYPLFEFTEDEILELSMEESNQTIFNKINVVYGEPDETNKSGESNKALIQEPTTDIGYGFYADEYLKTPVTELPKFGTVYFAVWEKTILDWEFITDARIQIIHNNAGLNVTNVNNEYVLEVIAEKKIAITEIVVDKLNVNKDSDIRVIVRLEDSNKKIYNPDITITVQDALADIRTQINAFNALFTKPTEIADVDITLTLNADLPVNDLSERNPNIVYVQNQVSKNKQKSNANQDVRTDNSNWTEFLYRIPVNECLLSTIDFNLFETNTSYAYLDNVEIVKDSNNAMLFGKNYIRAVTYSNPRTAYNRVKYIYILFRTYDTKKSLSFKFKLYGRKFIDTGTYIDYEDLNYTATNTTSIAKYGDINGGYLISNYLSEVKQTENLAKKLVSIYGYPFIKVLLQLPLLNELKKNIMIKVTSPNSGLNNYYYINAIEKTFDGCRAECYLLRTTRLVRNQGVGSEYDLYSRSMEDMALSPFFNALLDKNKGIEKGIVLVAHQDNTCDLKIFGSNSKFMRVNVLQGLNVKKNDKVLCALAADNTRVVIAILEKFVENIEYEEPNTEDEEIIVEPDEELDEGFKEAQEIEDKDTLTVKISTDIVLLWRYDGNTDEFTSYEAVPKRPRVAVITNAPVDASDICTRFFIRKKSRQETEEGAEALSGNIELVEQGRDIVYIENGEKKRKIPCNGIIFKDATYEYDKRYEVSIFASKDNPLMDVTGNYKLTKTIEFDFQIEPVFHIIGVRVLNPNAFEVLLSHPLKPDFKLNQDNYLIENLTEA